MRMPHIIDVVGLREFVAAEWVLYASSSTSHFTKKLDFNAGPQAAIFRVWTRENDGDKAVVYEGPNAEEAVEHYNELR